MDTLYDRLKIEKNATSQEIKKSYAKNIRLHPPEKDPQMFIKIKEAYETLINENTRAQYDKKIKKDEEINKYEQIINIAWENKNYKEVIQQCKQILLINKKLYKYLYKLSLALHLENKTDEAIKCAIELVDNNPNNDKYNKHIAMLYKNKKEYLKSETYLLKLYNQQPLDEEIIYELVDIYIKLTRYTYAILLLQEGIEKYHLNKQQKTIYYKNMIKVYGHKEDIEEINNIIDNIEEKLINNTNDKKHIANNLYKVAKDLYNEKKYKASEVVANRAQNIYEAKYINELYKASKHENEKNKKYKRLETDTRITDEIKKAVYIHIYDNKDKQPNLKQIKIQINKAPDKILNSIKTLKKDYNIFFEPNKEYYIELFKEAQKLEILQGQYKAIKSDFSISVNVENLVTLKIRDDLNEEEKKLKLEEIKKEIETERPEEVYKSLNKIKSTYFKIYELNHELVEELIEKFKVHKKPEKNKVKHKKRYDKQENKYLYLIIILAFITSIFFITHLK